MVLYIDAAFREGSRSQELANYYLKKCQGNLESIHLGNENFQALNSIKLAQYNEAVAKHDFTDPMFNPAKQFAAAEEIVIAAPFWNFTLPAVLHDYLELVCSQGITFDLKEDGKYGSLCHAKKLTFITTAGGYIPESDHAFGYIKSLCEVFWQIKDVKYYKAEGLDIDPSMVPALLELVKKQMDEDMHYE